MSILLPSSGIVLLGSIQEAFKNESLEQEESTLRQIIARMEALRTTVGEDPEDTGLRKITGKRPYQDAESREKRHKTEQQAIWDILEAGIDEVIKY